jgi:hypothetical protein
MKDALNVKLNIGDTVMIASSSACHRPTIGKVVRFGAIDVYLIEAANTKGTDYSSKEFRKAPHYLIKYTSL